MYTTHQETVGPAIITDHWPVKREVCADVVVLFSETWLNWVDGIKTTDSELDVIIRVDDASTKGDVFLGEDDVRISDDENGADDDNNITIDDVFTPGDDCAKQNNNNNNNNNNNFFLYNNNL